MEYILHQKTQKGCGAAALKMLLASVFKKEDYLYINFHKEEASMQDLIDEAIKYGVKLTPYDASGSSGEFAKLRKPIIALLNVGGRSHFVYIKAPNRKILTVYDPQGGKYYLTRKVFLTYFSGYFLEASEVSSGPTISIKAPKLERKVLIVDTLLQILTMFAFLGAMYTMNANYYFYVSLAFLGITFLLYYLERLYLNKALLEFDKSNFTAQFQNKKKLTIEALAVMGNYKKTLFTLPLEVIGSVMIVAILSVFLALNNVYHLLGIALSLLLISLLNFLGDLLKGHLSLKAINLQNEIFNANLNAEEQEKTYALLAKHSYDYGSVLISLNVLKIVILAGSVAIIMAISGLAAINYFLFYFFVYHLITTKVFALTVNESKDNNHYDHKAAYIELFENIEPK